MKIKALNEPDSSNSTSDESSSDVGKQLAPGKEILEEQCFDKYQRALLAIQGLRHDEGRDLLEELDHELEKNGSQSETLNQLRFSVLMNLGNLDTDDIEYYVKALAIDTSDISLWVRTGDRALKTGSMPFARICYEQALDINANNCIAIDRLIELYYVLHLPLELHDICMRALSLNKFHSKARLMLDEAQKLQPNFGRVNSIGKNILTNHDRTLKTLTEIKRKRRDNIVSNLQKFKRARLCITLDTARTQSLASFGNYIIRIYERFAKQFITRNTIIDITINNSSSFSQQFNSGSVNSQSNNQNSSEPQTTCSQDIEMAIDGDEGGVSNGDNDKSDNRNEPTMSNDEMEQPKTNSRSGGRNNQSFQKNSSLSFAAMLFPMDLNDKRRSSRNRSNQDDVFSFKMKFDELNELLPESLRICAIEQTLQRRREEQQIPDGEASKSDDPDEAAIVETNLDPVREDLIVKDVIEVISGQAQSTGTAINNIKLCDMFHVFLSKLSAKKQNTLPDAFSKIYRVYRKMCPLPTSVFVEIGHNGVELDELWFTLTANEVKYHSQECLFLMRILEQLQIYLDEAQHKEFLVRLFLIMGLNSDYRYLELALQNIEEDARVYASNRKIITRAHIKTLIDRKTEKLQEEAEAIEESDNSLEIVNRLAPKSQNEMSDREIVLLCNAIKSAKVWQRGLNILNQRNDLNSDIIIETINACLENGAEMDAIVASKLCKEAISGSRPATWTCLYRGWKSVLTTEELSSEKTIKNMDKFFDLGHQTLGKKCSCTTDKGEFLMLHVKHLLDEERDGSEERDLLASMNCLFGYPSKKPASVVGHKATKVPILWEYAEVVYDYLSPEELPTYMSLLRKAGITSEVECLLREIAEATPPELDPKRAVDIIEDFIEHGKPIFGLDVTQNSVTKDLFYLLADYYFKNKDFNTARKFYHYDLVINPDRFDSWAASGLIRASDIDKALSDGAITSEDFAEGPFRKVADSAIRCFEQATRLNPNETNATLWIEFGNLTYNLTSLASRLYIYDDFEMEIDGKEPVHTDKLVERHKRLYKLAKHCFMSANQLCECNEVWLHYYMLGKIYEKTDTLSALEYYYKADAQLFHEGACYPKKISYHNPPELAYEAMEVHYRIHAAALKYLLTTDEITQETMDRIKRFLLNAQRSPFVEMVGVQKPKETHLEQLTRDVDLLIHDTLDSIFTEASFDDLIFMCLHGMKRCLVRCDKNFKALYRLAFYYRKIRDSRMSQDILISREIRTDKRVQNLLGRRSHLPEFMAAPPDLNGVDSLFKDRKLGNLFSNIWRMPVEEVDRPGCFEHWMFKCIWLLIKDCLDLNDTNMLTIISFQLSRQPETSKKYLQDRPRVMLALFAVRSVISIVMDAIDKASDIDTRQHFIREGLVLADKFIKGNVFPDKMRDLFDHLQSQCAPTIPLMTIE